LTLKRDFLVSRFAFTFNLCCYTTERTHGMRAQAGAFEFVVGFDGRVQLIGISRVEWLKHVAPRAQPAGAGVNVARQPRSSAAGNAAGGKHEVSGSIPGGGGGGATVANSTGTGTGGGGGNVCYGDDFGGTGGTFGEEDMSFFDGGATVTTTVEGCTVGLCKLRIQLTRILNVPAFLISCFPAFLFSCFLKFCFQM
jgi:hypothetical protein